MARSMPLVQPTALPTPVASQVLTSLQQALQTTSRHSPLHQAQPALVQLAGLDLKACDLEAAHSAAQIKCTLCADTVVSAAVQTFTCAVLAFHLTCQACLFCLLQAHAYASSRPLKICDAYSTQRIHDLSTLLQIVLSQLRQWKPQQAPEGVKSIALPPISSSHRPSRLQKVASNMSACL